MANKRLTDLLQEKLKNLHPLQVKLRLKLLLKR
jgi:hypothetical protein